MENPDPARPLRRAGGVSGVHWRQLVLGQAEGLPELQQGAVLAELRDDLAYRLGQVVVGRANTMAPEG